MKLHPLTNSLACTANVLAALLFALPMVACGSDAAEDSEATEEDLTGLPALNAPLLVAPPEVYGAKFPQMTRDRSGNLYIAYTMGLGRWATYFAKYDVTTRTWSNRKLWNYGGYQPIVRVDSKGGVHVLASADSGGPAAYFVSTDGGASFTEDERIRKSVLPNLTIGGTCDMVLDDNDSPHIACTVGEHGGGPSYITRSAGDSWSQVPLGVQPRVDYRTPNGLKLFKEYESAAHIDLARTSNGTVLPRIIGSKGTFASFDGNHWSTESFAPEGILVDRTRCGAHSALSVRGVETASVMFYSTVDHTVHLAERTSQGWTTKSTDVKLDASHQSPTLSAVVDSSGRFTRALLSSKGSMQLLRSSGSTWTASPIERLVGNEAAVIRTGSSLYLAYIGANPGLEKGVVFARIKP